MKSRELEVYTRPGSMEPLMPTADRADLEELTCAVLTASGRLTGLVHSPIVRERVAVLVREMNCYYSNLIEGHKTLPKDIERALKNDFLADRGEKDSQLLSVAHIGTETRMAEWLQEDAVDVYAPDFVCRLHREFYARLPASLRVAGVQGGTPTPIVPGQLRTQLRTFMVDVGHHTPPHFDAVPAFLDRFHAFYGSGRIHPTHRLIAIAAAHHRMVWIHPFSDGNGRVVRLHSHALLAHHDMAGGGLWTLARGLARNREQYYRFLQAADRPRENDYDGRGNLSDRGLSDFCRFFLETMLDQVRFMDGLLELSSLRARIERYFQFEALHITRYREELMRVVRALADEGEIARARVRDIAGKGATVSAEIIKLGLREGLLETPSEKGPLRIGFPAKVLPAYFPQLFIDLPVQQEA